MTTHIRTVLAVVAGVVVGGVINGTIISVGPALIPLPSGVDPSDPTSLAGSMHLFEPRHFTAPFLAHALGTLVGAFTAYVVADQHRVAAAMAVGTVFLTGGIAASLMIPAPAWFIAVDLLLAYLPMAWLATRLGALATPRLAPAAAA